MRIHLGVEDLSALGTSNLSEGRDAKRAAVTAFKRALLEHCQNQMNIVPEEKNDVEYFKNPSPKKKRVRRRTTTTMRTNI